ncbi:hypothetical protein [Bartonella henselae]|uniref:hypothetical protein n=1 Tax=Bartonella henselae TaxID=38323 RepID=UPI0003DF91EE|nr:hypothetical protein [Bartonella henselae]ETS11180.1 hypothetical protein Q653_00096 [Bartonella henselae JK 42]ETS11181.1 hypothetical protein Q653_00097 [Bartonella henselae JK 42]ETS15186.1 hypothetical protein Q652_00229 [Bartonella henselae JK 41]MDM9998660.1 hypothetical protein [Bartonella henselae]UJM43465.1 hypothetical protein KAE73_01430 [Bartonella henselae]
MKNVLSILITIIFIISQVVNVNAGFWNGAPQDSKTAFFIQQQNNAITQQYKGQFIQAVNIPFMLTPEASIGKETDLFSEGKIEKVFVMSTFAAIVGSLYAIWKFAMVGAAVGTVSTTISVILGVTLPKVIKKNK